MTWISCASDLSGAPETELCWDLSEDTGGTDAAATSRVQTHGHFTSFHRWTHHTWLRRTQMQRNPVHGFEACASSSPRRLEMQSGVRRHGAAVLRGERRLREERTLGESEHSISRLGSARLHTCIANTDTGIKAVDDSTHGCMRVLCCLYSYPVFIYHTFSFHLWAVDVDVVGGQWDKN